MIHSERKNRPDRISSFSLHIISQSRHLCLLRRKTRPCRKFLMTQILIRIHSRMHGSQKCFPKHSSSRSRRKCSSLHAEAAGQCQEQHNRTGILHTIHIMYHRRSRQLNRAGCLLRHQAGRCCHVFFRNTGDFFYPLRRKLHHIIFIFVKSDCIFINVFLILKSFCDDDSCHSKRKRSVRSRNRAQMDIRMFRSRRTSRIHHDQLHSSFDCSNKRPSGRHRITVKRIHSPYNQDLTALHIRHRHPDLLSECTHARHHQRIRTSTGFRSEIRRPVTICQFCKLRPEPFRMSDIDQSLLCSVLFFGFRHFFSDRGKRLIPADPLKFSFSAFTDPFHRIQQSIRMIK